MRPNVEFRVDLPKTNPGLAKPHLQRHVTTCTKNTPNTMECGFTRIVLEGDYEVLYKAIQKETRCLTHFGHLTVDIHFLISHFTAFKLSLFVDIVISLLMP